MSDVKRRRHFSGQEKVAILRRHLVDKVAVSNLCDEYGIHPTLFYRWQRDWFEQGAVVFDGARGRSGAGGASESAGVGGDGSGRERARAGAPAGAGKGLRTGGSGNGSVRVGGRRGLSASEAAARIAALEAKLRRKDEVLSELMEEHVALKKSLGED
jgi:transposase